MDSGDQGGGFCRHPARQCQGRQKRKRWPEGHVGGVLSRAGDLGVRRGEERAALVSGSS